MTSIIQKSVIFNLHKWTIIKAAQWIQEHEFKIKKIDITINQLLVSGEGGKKLIR